MCLQMNSVLSRDGLSGIHGTQKFLVMFTYDTCMPKYV